jgi:hypothetical protein
MGTELTTRIRPNSVVQHSQKLTSVAYLETNANPLFSVLGVNIPDFSQRETALMGKKPYTHG